MEVDNFETGLPVNTVKKNKTKSELNVEVNGISVSANRVYTASLRLVQLQVSVKIHLLWPAKHEDGNSP